jgi:hypothetical protein
MSEHWRPWIATYPILEKWSGSGWPGAVELLAEEAWGAIRENPAGDAGPSDFLSQFANLGASSSLADGLGEALRDAIRTGVRFGAMLGFALARTYPGSSEELDGWLERAIEYAGESMGVTCSPEDDPSAV